MQHFTKLADVGGDPSPLVASALEIKRSPWMPQVGTGKCVGMIFFNPSLRTRMSTQRAAQNLGMQAMVMNIGTEGWQLEMADGAVMDGGTQEHIKDAVRVMSSYVDVLAVRTFPSLTDRAADYAEATLAAFQKYSMVPVVSLESATRHPLQSLADLVTIQEMGIARPKITVTWAPHPRALPQAVTNSFLEWARATDAQITLAHPPGYELAEEFTQGVTVTHSQEEALAGADFVYCKNWSSYAHYGQRLEVQGNWTVTREKMALTKHPHHFMHCLPVRRNVVVADAVLDHSLVYQQAENRLYAAQAVLKQIITDS